MAGGGRARERRFRGEPAVELDRRRRSRPCSRPDVGHDRRLVAAPRGRAPGPSGWARRPACRPHRPVCRCSPRGRTASRSGATASAGVSVDLEGLAAAVSTTTACRSTALLVGRPGWTRRAAHDPRRHRAVAGVDRCRRAGVPVPAPDRGHRDRARAGAADRHDDRPDRTAAGADRVRVASLPPAARSPAQPMAAPAARPAAPRARRPGHPDRRRHARSRRRRRRSAGAPSTTATHSAATAASRSRTTTAAPSSCGAAPGYPFAQVWVPPGKPFAALEPMTAPTNALVDRQAPVVAPRRHASPQRSTLTLDHTRTEEHHVDAHRGLRDHRRHQDGRGRRPRRIDRLVVRPAHRLRGGLRRAARRTGARAVDASRRRARSRRRAAQLRRRLAGARDRVRHRRRHREGDRLHVAWGRAPDDLPDRRRCLRLGADAPRAHRPVRLRLDRAVGAGHRRRADPGRGQRRAALPQPGAAAGQRPHDHRRVHRTRRSTPRRSRSRGTPSLDDPPPPLDAAGGPQGDRAVLVRVDGSDAPTRGSGATTSCAR